ncbi:hypothetical protein KsCSTR_26350 [Candidatus Kuenenia stuttgartiensis]|uniref:Glucosamine/galactosamine-6-phosphate isomerase domain-containing protein n=1 Tax=Kuenenia stuttgartiensis TaxID=174633 RepID=A0A6G7GRN0_KUEST|nr:6-phosphogluconolactonase [Planctomycetia bacterium]MBZ0190723.1 6-phosphogluconolactonase [Candidatus Kuenenia stuttgartiensis]MCF6151551.1 hypothetical protein [Candidatus Kuenenia stuttgartiensis]MCL4726973.1 6-phosphogluconolactonase [Candidatus Kuenenia stuttgartiensis]QII12014.1 hypothetical protein KsCSTR_26350 [Candidatus Kuenenia stuttgartiensis]
MESLFCPYREALPPECLYSLLAKPPYRDQILWNKTFVFWGDERFVPFNNKLNNVNMAKALLLEHIISHQ